MNRRELLKLVVLGALLPTTLLSNHNEVNAVIDYPVLNNGFEDGSNS